jgi:hypothetical protein
LNNPLPTAKESRNSVQDVWLNELDMKGNRRKQKKACCGHRLTIVKEDSNKNTKISMFNITK